MAFGTAPRKIQGVWYTRKGRKLTDVGQRYWENKHRQGFVDTTGHTNPASVEAIPHPGGLAVKGNIDIQHRPKVRNADGSVSSVRSIGITDDRGRNIVIPTVIPDQKRPGRFKVGTDDEAKTHFRQTGQHLGIFKTQAQADQYARQLHQQQARMAPAVSTAKAVQPTGPIKKPSFDTYVKVKHGDPEAIRQVKLYNASQQAGKEAEQTRGQLQAAKGYDQPVFKQAAKAAPVINPIAGKVIEGLSPGPGVIEGAKKIAQGIRTGSPQKIGAGLVTGGLAASAILPGGGARKGGQAIVKAVEEAKAATVAEKTAGAARSAFSAAKEAKVVVPAAVPSYTDRLVTNLAAQKKISKAVEAGAPAPVKEMKRLEAERKAIIAERAAATKGAQVLPVPSQEARQTEAAFSGAQSGRAAMDVRRSQQFRQRVGKVDQAFEAEGGGRAGHFAGLRQMGGEYDKLPFNDLRHASQETLDRLHNEIQDLPHLQTMEKRRLGIAIENAATEGLRPQQNEIDLMHKAFGGHAAEQFANPSNAPMGDVISNIANIPRSIMSAGDLSAPFRQGLMAFAMNPKLAAKQLPKMFRDFASEAHYGKGVGEIHADPEYVNSLKAGVGYTELGPSAARREESFGSKAAEGISPGLLIGKPGRGGSIVRSSGRAYTGFLDRVRLEMYKSLKAEAQAAGHDLGRVQSFGPGQRFVRKPQTLDKDLGDLVNWATGRGTFKSKKLEGLAPVLNSIFFSPRLFKSRLDAVNPAFYNRLDPFAQKKARNAVIKLVATGSGILALAKYVGGADIELDPRSSDWGKIRIGKTRYDIWGGYQQVARTIAQEITQTTKSSTTGEFKHPRHAFDPGITFFENKFSPPFALAKDIHLHQMFGGKPVTPLNELKEKGQPILWQDIHDAIRSGDWKNAAATAGLGTFGFGAQTYSSQKPKGGPVISGAPVRGGGPTRNPTTGRFAKKRDPNAPSWAQDNHVPMTQPQEHSGDPNAPSWAR